MRDTPMSEPSNKRPRNAYEADSQAGEPTNQDANMPPAHRKIHIPKSPKKTQGVSKPPSPYGSNPPSPYGSYPHPPSPFLPFGAYHPMQHHPMQQNLYPHHEAGTEGGQEMDELDAMIETINLDDLKEKTETAPTAVGFLTDLPPDAVQMLYPLNNEFLTRVNNSAKKGSHDLTTSNERNKVHVQAMLKALIDKDVTWRKNYQAAVRAKQREVEDLKRQVKSEYDAELKDYQLQIDELEKKKNATKGTMETRLAKLGETHAGIIAIANETVEAQNKDPICTEVPRASKLFDYLFSTIDSAAKYDYANLSKNEQAKNQLANETQSLYNEYFKLVSSYNAKNWSSFDQMYHELCSKKSQGNLGL